MIDILDTVGNSLLASGPISFTNSIEIRDLQLPADGTYKIQIYPPVTEEASWYGWYQIYIE